MNIVESIKENINPNLVKALATANTESVEKTMLTVDTSITSLLLAFMKRASTETGLHLLHNLTSAGNFSDPNPVDSLFPSDKLSKLADEGNALISKIIPDKKSPLITFVSSYSGVRNASANRTNGVITLLVLNKLKEVTAAKALDLGGLAELFADQKDFLLESAPKSLIEKLSQHIGLGNLISLGSSIISTSANLSSKNDKEKQKSTEPNSRFTSNEKQQAGGFNVKNWIIPGVFGLLILGLVGYYFYSEVYGTADKNEVSSSDSLVNINDSSKIDAVKSKQGELTKNDNPSDTVVVEIEEQTLPNGQKLFLEKGNLALKMYNFLTDSSNSNTKNITSNKINFDSSGSELVSDQEGTYDDISKIMKAFPQSRLKIAVNDFVGNDTLATEKKGNSRAFSIKRILLNNGIQPIRVDAIGKINHNKATDKLRAREVELTVMKK